MATLHAQQCCSCWGLCTGANLFCAQLRASHSQQPVAYGIGAIEQQNLYMC